MAPDPAPGDARLAAIRAGFRGDEDTARTLLGRREAAVRSSALGALARMGALSDADLVAALADPAVDVRRRALELAGAAVQPVAAGELDDALVAVLQGTDDVLAEVAAWALGERHQHVQDPDEAAPDPAPARVVDALVGATTGHADALVREAAVAALGCIGEPSSLHAVLAACHDKATVRRRAVLALAAFDGPEVDAALHAAREDRDWQVRQAAEDLLG